MQKQTDPWLKDTLYTEKLENGLTVAVLHRPDYKQITARVAVGYGSNDSRFIHPETGQEVALPAGIAHFLEHKLFEDETGNVSDKFAELGAESNAYTTHTHTVYYFNTTLNFERCYDLLLEFVQEAWFTAESVAKEQGIIEQEIRMYMDDPGWRATANLVEALYAVHPVRIDIAGTVESIRQIDKEILYLCHQTFYHPTNMLLFVAGNVDPKKAVAMAKASFGKRTYGARAPIQRLLPEEPPAIHQKRRGEELVVSQSIFRMGFKDRQVGKTGRELLGQDLVTSMVMDAVCGRGSSLYTDLYEAGLIDQRFGFEYSPEESYGYSCFTGPTRDPAELERRLLAGIEAVKQTGLVAADFERARKKCIGRVISFMNDLDSIAFVTIDGFFKGISLFDLLPVAMELTLAMANQRLQEHFAPEQSAVVIIHPKPGLSLE